MRLVVSLLALAVAGCATTGTNSSASGSSIVLEAQSAESRTRTALERIAELNPRTNAVIAVDPTAVNQARSLDRNRAARGALFGMPILIKDNIEVAGPLPTTAGSMALANNVTGRDAPLVARLRAAGAVIVGKANLSEWANIRDDDSISGWSAIGGQTRNPHALNRNACGSSTGSAVAVAAGMVPAAIGTETDGSITCPAAVSGVVGFKPTVGLVSRTHVIPISVSQDTPGPMARTVREAAMVLEAMVGSDPADAATAEADRRRAAYAQQLSTDSLRGQRIGVLRLPAGSTSDEAFDAALATLRAQGAILVDIAEVPNRAEIGRSEFTVLLHEFKSGLNEYLATTPPSVTTRTLADVIEFNRRTPREMALFDQDTFEQAQATDGVASQAYRTARATSLRLAGTEGIDKLLRDNNVVALVGPTRGAAWLIDAVHGDASVGGMPVGSLAAVAGYPHLTVPMGAVRGLPVGLSFVGPKWSDAMILSLGYAYEQASQRRVEPRFLPSVEDGPETAPALRPLTAGN